MHADHNIKISLINFCTNLQDFCAMAFSNTNPHYTESGWTAVEKSYPIEMRKNYLTTFANIIITVLKLFIYLRNLCRLMTKNLGYLASHI
ncbi:MAG: hypothetical protein ACR5KX_00330 [Wolbachia sp.]